MGPHDGRRRNGWRLAAAVLALAVLGIVAAGCGGGSPSAGVAQLATTTAAATTTDADSTFGGGSGGGPSGSSSGRGGQASVHMSARGASRSQALAFAQCMRRHGVPSFPDPSSDGSFSFSGSPKSVAGFQSASQACQKFLPEGKPASPAQKAKMRRQALAFSACMRSHGFPQFPDPTFTDRGFQMRLDKNAGMDPNSPRFQQAQQACGSFLPGKVATK